MNTLRTITRALQRRRQHARARRDDRYAAQALAHRVRAHAHRPRLGTGRLA